MRNLRHTTRKTDYTWVMPTGKKFSYYAHESLAAALSGLSAQELQVVVLDTYAACKRLPNRAAFCRRIEAAAIRHMGAQKAEAHLRESIRDLWTQAQPLTRPRVRRYVRGFGLLLNAAESGLLADAPAQALAFSDWLFENEQELLTVPRYRAFPMERELARVQLLWLNAAVAVGGSPEEWTEQVDRLAMQDGVVVRSLLLSEARDLLGSANLLSLYERYRAKAIASSGADDVGVRRFVEAAAAAARGLTDPFRYQEALMVLPGGPTASDRLDIAAYFISCGHPDKAEMLLRAEGWKGEVESERAFHLLWQISQGAGNERAMKALARHHFRERPERTGYDFLLSEFPESEHESIRKEALALALADPDVVRSVGLLIRLGHGDAAELRVLQNLDALSCAGTKALRELEYASFLDEHKTIEILVRRALLSRALGRPQMGGRARFQALARYRRLEDLDREGDFDSTIASHNEYAWELNLRFPNDIRFWFMVRSSAQIEES